MAKYNTDSQSFTGGENETFVVHQLADKYGAVITPVSTKDVKTSPFGEQQVLEKTILISVNSANGTSALRDTVITSNSASTSNSSGEIVLSTGATANSLAEVRTKQLGTYVPGLGAEVGIGVRIPTLPVGTEQATWGGWSVAESDGFYFGVDATGIFVAYDNNNTINKIYQADWNIDTADGAGRLGTTLDLAKGNIFLIEFSWYGYGEIRFGYYDVVGNKQTLIPVHSLRVEGQTSIQDPNLSVFAKADNGSETSDFTMYLGGRQYSILGKYLPQFRYTGDTRAGVATSTTAAPLVSFRRKTGIFANRTVELSGLTVDVASEPVIVEIRVGGTLTNAAYRNPTNYTAAETALETDTNATAISGGNVIYTEYYGAGKGNDPLPGTSSISLGISAQENITVCARTLSGTGSVSAHFRLKELW